MLRSSTGLCIIAGDGYKPAWGAQPGGLAPKTGQRGYLWDAGLQNPPVIRQIYIPCMEIKQYLLGFRISMICDYTATNYNTLKNHLEWIIMTTPLFLAHFVPHY